jgi:histidinol-phosphate aminotransferase
MRPMLNDEGREDLIIRGYSRRDLGRIGAIFGLGAATAASFGLPAWASAGKPDPAPDAKVRIGANECWTGPFPVAQTAAAAIIASGNRYSPHDERGDFIRAVNKVEGAPETHVAPWPGSSDPLSRSVVSYCSPTRGLVTADPTFELAGRTAEWLGAPVKRVPLTADFRHDVKAMLAADPKAGLYYICTPNNPTGTVTPLEDIKWLLDNKPADSMVLVDEAYIHFADVPSAAPWVAQRKDLIVMRTFSKIFGMAGMRMGYIMTDPANLDKMMRYDGGMQSGALPLPSLACATASLTAAADIAARRAEMRDARAMTLAHLKKR